jgi:hypothetical protein
MEFASFVDASHFIVDPKLLEAPHDHSATEMNHEIDATCYSLEPLLRKIPNVLANRKVSSGNTWQLRILGQSQAQLEVEGLRMPKVQGKELTGKKNTPGYEPRTPASPSSPIEAAYFAFHSLIELRGSVLTPSPSPPLFVLCSFNSICCRSALPVCERSPASGKTTAPYTFLPLITRTPRLNLARRREADASHPILAAGSAILGPYELHMGDTIDWAPRYIVNENMRGYINQQDLLSLLKFLLPQVTDLRDFQLNVWFISPGGPKSHLQSCSMMRSSFPDSQ